MRRFQQEPWSNNANAPNIPSFLYHLEKSIFVGVFTRAICTGIVIVLFFRCMSALLNPINNAKRNIRWPLVAHTTAMFALFMITSVVYLAMESYCYVDKREFHGGHMSIPGPLGYPWQSVLNGITIIGFPLNQWLADGLLLYRCHVIYSMNFRATVFPSLIYITTIAVGATSIHKALNFGTSMVITVSHLLVHLKTSYNSISLVLNVTLMSMIIVRLVLHSRAMQKAAGSLTPTSRLYFIVIAILVESSSLYTISLLLYIITWAQGQDDAASAFGDIVGSAQVIAPFLIILRVANRRAVTSEEMSSGNVSSIRFGSHGESTADEGTVPDEIPASTVDSHGGPPGGDPVGVENRNIIEEVPLGS